MAPSNDPVARTLSQLLLWAVAIATIAGLILGLAALFFRGGRD